MLIRDLRLPGADPSSHPAPVSLRAEDGLITAIGADLRPRDGEEVHEAAGALAVPGLWDHHVHAGQTAQGYSRLDTAGLASVDEVLRAVASALTERESAGTPQERLEALVGFGHRLVDLAGEPTVAALDAVCGPDLPVVLIGGDAHHAWMSSAALRGLGLAPRRGIVAEDEWFDAVVHLDDLPGVARRLEAGIVQMQEDALASGIVGITDMEWATNWELWQRRSPRIRVRTATYASGLAGVPGPTGTPLGDSGLVTMGPLKVIADGSLGSRSAYCRHPYAFSGETGAEPLGGGYGVLSPMAEDLASLLEQAATRGLEAAVHAIGDAAVSLVLDAFAARGGRGGRIEHAQLLADEDVTRMAALGIRASVQPAHLLDDRDPTEDVWPEDTACAYRFRDLLDAGVPLLMGSDSPVAPVDPWLAMSAAVHRSADAREAWFPAQQLQPREALAASTNGIAELAVGGPADLLLLPEDVFAPVPRGAGGLMEEAAAREAALRLRSVRPLATVLAGTVAFSR
ncbi:hydrolase [Brachybacterium endophyticum]|uniref:Hydrolase n=1 Tax=Brachybacterium endophyticum TaxID=2182385 RepID=A0A2U2RNU9_9MICO|nr:amidohydrolase family protein [Brachybacterium endophyticum]PWH07511.1 hydrolase [Brachybacterium endophyticum]